MFEESSMHGLLNFLLYLRLPAVYKIAK